MTRQGAPHARERQPPAAAGQRIAHYQIVSEIGRGGMGIVFRARDLRLGRDVALKCPWPALAERPVALERFLREARSAARISHPNIVPVFQIVRAGGLPWLAMELVEGRSLRALLRDTGAIAAPKAVYWGELLADALRAAHDKGVVHRDVNPNNILLRSDGWPLLTDFGLAHVLLEEPADADASTAGDPLTDAGQLVGTRCYMPPEQLIGGRVDRRTDIFALGAVLYEMCTARRPFQAADGAGEIDAVLHGTPPPMSDFAADIPPDLERIVRRALAKRPEERYQDARDLALELGALRRRQESSPESASPPVPASRRPTALVIAAAVATLAAAGTVIWKLGAGREAPAALPVGAPRQVTSESGSESEPAISPDGSLIAYTSSAAGNPDVWITDLQGSSRLRLTDDPASDTSPTWFPDGSAIAFVSDRGGIPSVWKVPRLGGAAVLVAPQAVEPAVSPDGTRIAFARTNAAGYLRIVVAPIDEPSRARVITGDGDGDRQHREPVWSPDGRTLCYADEKNLWLIGPDGGPARRLTHEHAGDSGPAFSADGRFVLFSSLRDGTRALWRVPAAGGQAERLTIGTGPESQPATALNGSNVAYSTHLDDFDVVVRDLRHGRTAVIASVLYDATPAVAPDGSAVAFASARRGGRQDLWIQGLSNGMPAGPPRQLTDLPGTVNMPAFSPDGRWIAFKRESSGRREIWTLPAGGGAAERFSDGAGNDIHPAWSPDGRLMAFAAERDEGLHLHLAPVEAGRRSGPGRRLTAGSSTEMLPAWSPDGSLIAYVAVGQDEQYVRVVPTSGAGQARTVASGPSFGRLRWDGTTGWLWFASTRKDGPLRLLRMAPGRQASVAAVPEAAFEGAAAPGDFDISADARVLAFTRREVRGDIWLLERPQAPPNSR